ncbi:MAG: YtxH domain-containing protein, partial [Verrucomicrobia bacterium]|nr:YtxH domain-containing protein [Verrucomicrobiota bacterium]
MVSARDLGRRALEIGLETLDLAKIHETALAVLVSPESSSAMREDVSTQATDFFTEAITPIEKTHDAALKTARQLQEATATLEQRTSELADSEINLHEQISCRQAAETALNTSEFAFCQLLKDSLLLEKQLQDVARKVLSTDEEDRKKMIHLLQDEIEQTLLGIHVRLLALKKLTVVSGASLDHEIENIQRL